MKFMSKVKMFMGITFIFLLVALLTMYLNKTLSVIQSHKAELATDSTSVGTDYPGLVAAQNIVEGSTVTKGQILFEIQSAQFNELLADQRISLSTLPFTVNPDNNNIQLKAVENGVVNTINHHTGSFVPAGGIVATMSLAKSLHIVAHFSLSPPDYARIDKERSVKLRLPDNSQLEATIFNINLVRNDNNGVDTVVKARIKDADISDFRYSIGTPVDATLYLQQDDWHQPLVTYLKELISPSGR